MKRYYIIYRGQVQGVGFRFRLTELAYKYNITGWCKNLENGDVSCEFEGNEENTNNFLKDSLKEYYFIKVQDYVIKEITPKGDTKFEPIYY